ncbi:MAG: FAD-dependent oxidoreductase [Alphaproteobacteria bacterium]|nr:FAD-dependent oxidoreductase [Alphaproteobacteria bacterium]MBL7098253.1 FAD-dependent oxidoreductase [Alphaproteobacteria bacterium]
MAKIAIIGTGISGLGAAYLLNRKHEITVYEKAARIGGHSRTVIVDHGGKRIPVDTGFIVFNEKNYPHLSAMFRHLDVATHKSNMTFAASIRDGWLEWGAKDTNAVFGQRRNLLNPRFGLLIRDVLRFNAQAEETAERNPDLTLDEFLALLRLGDWFRRFYLLPMCSAIWSCPPREMMRFPARTLIRFMANHHLLSASGQPQWMTVTGGSQEYVRRLTASFAHCIRLNCGAASVTRDERGVTVADATGRREHFDQVVFASHADETLRLLADADDHERAVLSNFRYQPNLAVLHRDTSVMPKSRHCWASWVYASDGSLDEPRLSVTYWMNLLQGIPNETPLFVTLNPKAPIAPDKVFDTHLFDHPVFDHDAVAAQGDVQAMQGRRGTFFCGAHLRHGFHEDGLASAVHVARLLGCDTPWAAPVPGFPSPQWQHLTVSAAA